MDPTQGRLEGYIFKDEAKKQVYEDQFVGVQRLAVAAIPAVVPLAAIFAVTQEGVASGRKQVYVRKKPEPGAKAAITDYRTLLVRGGLSLVEAPEREFPGRLWGSPHCPSPIRQSYPVSFNSLPLSSSVSILTHLTPFAQVSEKILSQIPRFWWITGGTTPGLRTRRSGRLR